MGMIPEGETERVPPPPLRVVVSIKGATEKELLRFRDCEGCKKFDEFVFVINTVYSFNIYI